MTITHRPPFADAELGPLSRVDESDLPRWHATAQEKSRQEHAQTNPSDSAKERNELSTVSDWHKYPPPPPPPPSACARPSTNRLSRGVANFTWGDEPEPSSNSSSRESKSIPSKLGAMRSSMLSPTAASGDCVLAAAAAPADTLGTVSRLAPGDVMSVAAGSGTGGGDMGFPSRASVTTGGATATGTLATGARPAVLSTPPPASSGRVAGAAAAAATAVAVAAPVVETAPFPAAAAAAASSGATELRSPAARSRIFSMLLQPGVSETFYKGAARREKTEKSTTIRQRKKKKKEHSKTDTQ